MPNPRYPGAVWNPGSNAGYRAGRTTMRTAVCHYTVGRDSTGIGKQGYFQFLVARDGRVQQFAEADAVNWHAGSPWNSRGPGIEVEYLDEPTIFTPENEAATGALVDWLVNEWGIPRNFYDGPRIADHHGFITHRSLIQTGDAHSDYWPYLPSGGSDSGDDELNDLERGMLKDIWDRTKDMRDGVPQFGVPPWHEVTAAIGRIETAVNAGGGAGGDGLTGAQVAALIRAELNRTKLGPV